VQVPCALGYLTLLPLSIVASSAGLTTLFTLLLAASGIVGDQEALGAVQIAGAVLVLLGVTGVSYLAPHVEATPEEAVALAPRLVVPAALSLVGTATSLVLFSRQAVVASNEARAAESDGTGCANAALVLVLCFFAACSAGWSQIFVKLIGLVWRAQHIAPSHMRWILSTCTLGVALSSLGQLTMINALLTQAKASVGVPLYQSMLVAFCTSAAGIAFHEFDGWHTDDFTGYAVGLLLAVAGIVLLTRPARPPHPRASLL
jgi:hypothetical protein